jgi:hypothetical protein
MQGPMDERWQAALGRSALPNSKMPPGRSDISRRGNKLAEASGEKYMVMFLHRIKSQTPGS